MNLMAVIFQEWLFHLKTLVKCRFLVAVATKWKKIWIKLCFWHEVVLFKDYFYYDPWVKSGPIQGVMCLLLNYIRTYQKLFMSQCFHIWLLALYIAQILLRKALWDQRGYAIGSKSFRQKPWATDECLRATGSLVSFICLWGEFDI